MAGLDQAGGANVAETTAAVSHPRSWAAYGAAGAAFSFAAVSLYWALGGTAGLDTLGGSIERQAMARDPGLLPFLWAAVVLKVLGGMLALALVRPWGRRLSRRMLLVAAAGGSVLLTVYGVSQTVGVALLLAGVYDNPQGFSTSELRWRLFVWESWFWVWGLLLGVAAWRYRRTR